MTTAFAPSLHSELSAVFAMHNMLAKKHFFVCLFVLVFHTIVDLSTELKQKKSIFCSIYYLNSENIR